MNIVVKTMVRLTLLLLVISVITFFLAGASGVDPVNSYLGAEKMASPEQKEQLAEQWGLNDPGYVRYFKWLTSILSGDMGVSFLYQKPVVDIIKDATTNTILLMATAWFFSGLLGFFLGVVSAVYNGKVIDKIIHKFCYILSSTPTFWFGILMVIVFAVNLRIFPVGMASPIGKIGDQVDFIEKIYHMILPAITLSIVGISNIVLHTREKLVDVLNSDYVLFAKTRGETKWGIVKKHGIRNIILPAITLQFASISELFGGSVLVENVFSYSGLGNITKAAGTSGDIPLLLGITMISAIFVFTGNLIANLLYPIVDPRIRER